MDMQLMSKGLEVAVFGLGGVFTVLIMFYLSTKAMLQFSKRSNRKKLEEDNRKDALK
ncbi:MAG: oxaloacetate decarboxylase [Firmicutes bacterium HGW-Firmicutes-11]|jgi:Na+-transporting methylmalonyl-CoA/oxaloacetate decarboxylase gamma subunit|nr:MAG: oxaloacetate decarboxylase [Firmicutes bacterium HGW-Firmicutes-11]